MAAAVREFSREDLVAGVVVGDGGSADHDIHRREAGIGRDFVQRYPAAADLHAGGGVTHVEIGPRRTHGCKGAGSDHVHHGRRLLQALFPHDPDDFFGGKNHRPPCLDFLVDFLDGLGHRSPPQLVYRAYG